MRKTPTGRGRVGKEKKDYQITIRVSGSFLSMLDEKTLASSRSRAAEIMFACKQYWEHCEKTPGEKGQPGGESAFDNADLAAFRGKLIEILKLAENLG